METKPQPPRTFMQTAELLVTTANEIVEKSSERSVLSKMVAALVVSNFHDITHEERSKRERTPQHLRIKQAAEEIRDYFSVDQGYDQEADIDRGITLGLDALHGGNRVIRNGVPVALEVAKSNRRRKMMAKAAAEAANTQASAPEEPEPAQQVKPAPKKRYKTKKPANQLAPVS